MSGVHLGCWVGGFLGRHRDLWSPHRPTPLNVTGQQSDPGVELGHSPGRSLMSGSAVVGYQALQRPTPTVEAVRCAVRLNQCMAAITVPSHAASYHTTPTAIQQTLSKMERTTGLATLPHHRCRYPPPGLLYSRAVLVLQSCCNRTNHSMSVQSCCAGCPKPGGVR